MRLVSSRKTRPGRVAWGLLHDKYTASVVWILCTEHVWLTAFKEPGKMEIKKVLHSYTRVHLAKLLLKYASLITTKRTEI